MIKRINYCRRLLEYIGLKEEEVDLYIENIFSDSSDEEINALDIYDLNNILLSEITSNINYYLESGHEVDF